MIAQENQLEQLRTRLLGLIFACPFNQNNPHDCPLHRIRHCDLTERTHWLDTLPIMQLEALYRFHCHCLAQREMN